MDGSPGKSSIRRELLVEGGELAVQGAKKPEWYKHREVITITVGITAQQGK